MNSPDMKALRCEVLSFPKQVREILKTSERAVRRPRRPERGVGDSWSHTRWRFDLLRTRHHLPRASRLRRHQQRGDAPAASPAARRRRSAKGMHDAKSGLMVLAQRGVKTGTPAFDTQLAAFLLDGNVYDLEDLIADRLSLPAEESETIGSEERTRHICARADAVLRLGGLLEAELEERRQLGYLRELELQLVPVLADMELVGVAVDAATLEELSHRLAVRLHALEKEMAEAVGHEVNPRSPQRIGELLYDELGLEGPGKPLRDATLQTRSRSRR